MNKYEYLKASLEETGIGQMKCFGSSMLPILSNPSYCFYVKLNNYYVGDIVFCKVKGRFIDAHIITKKDNGRYLISNNHNFDNGWTKTIYGKVVLAYNKDNKLIYNSLQKKIKDEQNIDKR